ncbi:uncharacterized protein ASPGLDRAFT_1516526 [Aspergillus glaucus CBS 516.65]|uniref:Uncharacterized protein n=1 Tax=Aspergillus glaucus CBS 516.65 TaxID=1160497 RepID=A0A1L9VL53_ASPGL|nr:hypothetical protein ASPGLDRAFT_1516526 [Aspergillus glaucus CBS 516.65]OJJ84610.1 hypothetical protein ASPGLDRAFT_1516526 [Aspergillus glaucus CBS 516.65]
MVGCLRQTICSHFVGRKMYKADLPIIDMVLNSMILYRDMLCRGLIGWVVSNLDGSLVVFIYGHRCSMITVSFPIA